MNLKIIKKTAKDTGYTQGQVELVEEAIFRYLRNLMLAGKYEGLFLPYFGKFVVKEKRKQQFIERYGEDWDPGLINRLKRDQRRLDKLAKANADAREDVKGSPEDMQELPSE